jgi:parallel beta-helix repeat protein
VIRIYSPSVTLEGFEVRGGRVGIFLIGVTGTAIEDTIVVGNNFGIALIKSSSSALKDNIARGNKEIGILLNFSNDNTLKGNAIVNNKFGILLTNSSKRNALEGIEALGNGFDIVLDNSSLEGHTNSIDGRTIRGFVEGELLISFVEGVPEERIEAIIRELDAEVIRFFPIFGIYHLRIIVEVDTLKKIKEFNALPEVDIAEVNGLWKLAQNPKPNDEAFPMQWSLNNEGQAHPLGRGGQKRGLKGADIGILRPWEGGIVDSSGVWVGVIDSGVDPRHPDLASNLLLSYGSDTVNGDDMPEDNIGHGTFVAGIIGAMGNNGRDIAGVSWKASVIPLKASERVTVIQRIRNFIVGLFSNVTWADFADALHRSVELKRKGLNLKVINFSAGGPSRSGNLDKALAKVAEAGILFITAAGNEGQNNDLEPFHPCNYPHENIICVAASTDMDGLADFSNYGARSVDLFAPGEDIISLVARGLTGAGVLVNYYGCRGLEEFGFEAVAVCSGTSFATPHVTGIAALLFSICPETGPLEIKQIILNSVEQKSTFIGRVASGGRLKWPDRITCHTDFPEMF